MHLLRPHDRPREKLARLGPMSLGDNELLAVVIGSGTERAGALDVANAVLHATDGVHGIPRMGSERLERLGGIGPARAARILAAVELGRRTLTRPPDERHVFASPGEVAAFLMPRFSALDVEHFGAVLLDTRHRLVRTVLVSVGTLDSSPAHPREVFREATVASAAAVILFHNHPSGDPSPSPDDVGLTRRLTDAGQILGIAVLDHIIVGASRYFSFKEAGRL